MSIHTDNPLTIAPDTSIHVLDALDGPERSLQRKTIADHWQTLAPHIPPVLQSFSFLFISGINDSSLGIIMPSIRAHYGLSQYVVSIIFLSNTLGYIIAAVTNGYLVKYLSQYKTAIVGAASLVLGYMVVLFAVPFPLICVFMVFIGYGTALSQTSANVVCGEMPRATVMLGFLHACYAAGGMVGPAVASAILESNRPWNSTYKILCGVAGFNLMSVALSYRKLRIKSEKEADAERERLSLEPVALDPASEMTITPNERPPTDKSLLNQIFRYRIVTIGSIFLLLYVGTEVTLGNWGYTYLISTRSSDTAAMAHIMSGYWGGICASRLFFGYPTHRFGEKRMIFIYIAVMVGMLLFLWFVPFVPANATALVLIGLMLGPMFPTAVSIANKSVPTALYATAVGFLAAFGSAGAAIFPYISGVLIGAQGVKTVLPFCVALTGAMLITWVFVPDPGNSFFSIRRFRKKKDEPTPA